MSKRSLIRPLHLLGAIVILAPSAATDAASTAKHAPARASHSIPRAHLGTPPRRNEGGDQWKMLAVGLAAAGYAVRRQTRTLDSLHPLSN